MKNKVIFAVLILAVLFIAGCLMLKCYPLEDTADLLGRINELEQALEFSNKQLQTYQQKEAEYLKQIAELQAVNQKLEEKHQRNLEALFQ